MTFSLYLIEILSVYFLAEDLFLNEIDKKMYKKLIYQNTDNTVLHLL